MFEQAGRHPAVIVVDDERVILTILHRVLRDLTDECDIITATNGAEALAQLERRPVPLVITDYSMAGMNGLQLTAAIKERAPETCVVLITAFASPELRRSAHMHHVDHFLPKPFALDTLRNIIRATLA